MSLPEWANSGPETVADGVTRIPMPMGVDSLAAVNIYAIEDGDGVSLVDAGWSLPGAMDTLDIALRGIGQSVDRIRRIFVTHAHADHYTLAVSLRRRYGTHVAIGDGDRESIELLTAGGHPYQAQIDLARAAGSIELAHRLTREHAPGHDWEPPDEYLKAGSHTIGSRVLRVIPTPGHTHGHSVFSLGEERMMFTGDHLLPRITPSVGLEAVRREAALANFLDSLAEIGNAGDFRMLPAHGSTSGWTSSRVPELIEHHRTRLALMVDAVREAPESTVSDVAATIPWTRALHRLSDLDDFNQMLALNETAVHLDYLVNSGRLECRLEQGQSRYSV